MDCCNPVCFSQPGGRGGMMNRFFETDRGRRIFDHLRLNLPIIGSVYHSTAMSRFAVCWELLRMVYQF